MNILVLSDSHAALSFMRLCIDRIKPDEVIHLGDYYEDAQCLQEEYGHIPFHIVPGNCDRYRCDPDLPRVLCYEIDGVKMLMTHGHHYHVKMGIGGLVAEARRRGAGIAFYGHTHCPDCHCEDDGLWVVNPGTCGSYGGTAAIITTKDQKLSACRIITQADLEDRIEVQ